MINHMNKDHGDALLAIGRQYGGSEITQASLLALDPEGFHLKTEAEVLYVAFSQPCLDVEAVREALGAMAREARQAASEAS